MGVLDSDHSMLTSQSWGYYSNCTFGLLQLKAPRNLNLEISRAQCVLQRVQFVLRDVSPTLWHGQKRETWNVSFMLRDVSWTEALGARVGLGNTGNNCLPRFHWCGTSQSLWAHVYHCTSWIGWEHTEFSKDFWPRNVYLNSFLKRFLWAWCFVRSMLESSIWAHTPLYRQETQSKDSGACWRVQGQLIAAGTRTHIFRKPG